MALLLSAVLLGSALLWSCHSKEPGGDPPDELEAPLGVAFTIAGLQNSQAVFFDLNTLAVVRTVGMDSYAVAASALNRYGDKLIVADTRVNRLVMLRMPDMFPLHVLEIGGVPVDVDVSNDAGYLYAITHNGNFWVDTVATMRYDTLDVRLHPRRFALRPAALEQAWVVCVGNQTLHIFDLRRNEEVRAVNFDRAPTDVKFNAAGDRAYIAFQQDTAGVVVSYDAGTAEPLHEYPVGRGPFDVAVSDDNRYLAVSDSAESTLKIFDLTTDSSWTVAAGAGLTCLQFKRGTHTAFVLAELDNAVKRMEIGEQGPDSMTSVTFGESAHNLILWERRD